MVDDKISEKVVAESVVVDDKIVIVESKDSKIEPIVTKANPATVAQYNISGPTIPIKNGFWKNMLVTVAVLGLIALAFIGGAMYTSSNDKVVFTKVMNDTTTGYNLQLQGVAKNYQQYGYIMAVGDLYKYAGNCSVVTITDPVSNGTIHIRDIACPTK
jgi:hypothetical protein